MSNEPHVTANNLVYSSTGDLVASRTPSCLKSYLSRSAYTYNGCVSPKVGDGRLVCAGKKTKYSNTSLVVYMDNTMNTTLTHCSSWKKVCTSKVYRPDTKGQTPTPDPLRGRNSPEKSLPVVVCVRVATVRTRSTLKSTSPPVPLHYSWTGVYKNPIVLLPKSPIVGVTDKSATCLTTRALY